MNQGMDFPQVSINITGPTLSDESIINEIKHYLEMYQINPNKLCLEVTEQVLIDNMTVGSNNLDILKELGIQIVLNDLGTGYSSIQYINQLSIEFLKINRSFIKNIHQNKKAQAIIRLITNLAHDLGIELVAEGVETQEELNYVLHNCCNLVQGYLISPPPTIEDILNDHNIFYKFD